MCSKKSKNGLRLIVVSFVLSVLVLSPLAAWPFSFGKADTPADNYQVQPSQDIEKIQELKDQIQSLKQSKNELEVKLTEQQKMLDTLSSNLKASGTQINNTKATAESLLTEIESLKRSLQSSETVYSSLKSDYDALAFEYQAKVDESAGYFKQATKATEKFNAIKKSPWSTTIGAAAVLKGGEYGVDATLGVGYGPVTLFGGATYMLDNDFSFRLDDLAFKAGLTYTF